MDKIKSKLLSLVEQPSDINEHLFTLKGYAEGCEHITEMGVRSVVSTWAFLAAGPKTLIGIDIEDCPIDEIAEAAAEVDIDFQFIKDSTVRDDFEIEETDKHASKVRKYIGFHDTYTYGFVNEGGYYSQPTGLRPAIIEFLQTHPEWDMANSYNHNNGVTILKRIT